MFGYVTASTKELTKEQRRRYGSVYCGICRQIRFRSSNLSRMVLSYDMVFLALLHMSLYEPEETAGQNACMLHPIEKRPWVDNPYIRYAADMNVLLAYYKALDDWQDDKSTVARTGAKLLEKHCLPIRERYPRQARAIESCLSQLSRLEKENCPNPDDTAGTFGALMGELLVYEEDLWSSSLRRIGDSLGRFIYLMDAVCDYDEDRKKGKYNPFIAMGGPEDEARWREYLVLTMAGCCDAYERLPLVQDKEILDNILYSGVWVRGRKGKKEGEP